MDRIDALAAFLTFAAIPAAAPTEDLARAERLFAQHCAVCHGADRGGTGPNANKPQFIDKDSLDVMRTLDGVKSIQVDVPAGVFSRVRERSVVVGLQKPDH